MPRACPRFEPGEFEPVLRMARVGCPTCGYDLGGIDDAARCPECGALIDRVTIDARGIPLGFRARVHGLTGAILFTVLTLGLGGFVLLLLLVTTQRPDVPRDYVFGPGAFGERGLGPAFWWRWSEAAACEWRRVGDGSRRDLCIRCRRGKALLRVRLCCSDANAPLLAAALEARLGAGSRLARGAASGRRMGP